MEGRVAKWYAANTGKSMAEFTALAKRVSKLIPSGAVLDVAPGPGYFSIELAKLGPYRVSGLDISHTFVELALKRAAAEGVNVDFRQGSAAALPFADNTFDFLVCRAAFKNFADPVGAMREMWRVLKPGAQGLIIDLRHDASPREIARHVDEMGLSAINRLLTKLAFRTMLLKNAYTEDQFRKMLAQTSFRTSEVRGDGIGFEVWMTK